MAFCQSKDMKAQYTKSEHVFLKPKPVENESYESIVDSTTDKQDKADTGKMFENQIDPAGLLIFANDMNDEQKVSLFTDLTEKLFLTHSEGSSDVQKLAQTSKELLDLIPAAVFQTKDAKTRVYTQMANMVKAQLEASESGEINTETANLLTEQVSALVEVLPRSQAALMKALKTGLLRNIAVGAAGQVQLFSTPTFISKQIRAIRSNAEIKENKTLARM